VTGARDEAVNAPGKGEMYHGPYSTVGGPPVSLPRATESSIHCRFDARPTVTFPTIQHRRPLTITERLAEANAREQFA